MTESISNKPTTPYEQAALNMKNRSIKAKEDELIKNSLFECTKTANGSSYYPNGIVYSNPKAGIMKKVIFTSEGALGECIRDSFTDYNGDGKIDEAETILYFEKEHIGNHFKMDAERKKLASLSDNTRQSTEGITSYFKDNKIIGSEFQAANWSNVIADNIGYYDDDNDGFADRVIVSFPYKE